MDAETKRVDAECGCFCLREPGLTELRLCKQHKEEAQRSPLYKAATSSYLAESMVFGCSKLLMKKAV